MVVQVKQSAPGVVISCVLCGQVFSQIGYTFYVSACASDHACAYVGMRAFIDLIALKLYMWDLSLGIETLEEVRRKS